MGEGAGGVRLLHPLLQSGFGRTISKRDRLIHRRNGELQRTERQNLEELREQITEYYETYYAELRSQITGHDPATFQSVPDVFKGYRRIVTELGQDGVVVTHWPSSQDSFDFHISPIGWRRTWQPNTVAVSRS